MKRYGVIWWDIEDNEQLEVCLGPEDARRRLMDLWDRGSCQGICMVEVTEDGQPGQVIDERVRVPPVIDRLKAHSTRQLFDTVDRALRQWRRNEGMGDDQC